MQIGRDGAQFGILFFYDSTHPFRVSFLLHWGMGFIVAFWVTDAINQSLDEL